MSHRPRQKAGRAFSHSQLAAFRRHGAAGPGAEELTASDQQLGALLGEDFCRIGLGRPGVALYGANPCPGQPHPLTPVALHAPLIQVRRVPANSPVNGGTWTTARESMLGVLALGYADGWPRAASDHVSVALDGHEAPQNGRVSMDTVVLDLTDLPPRCSGSARWLPLSARVCRWSASPRAQAPSTMKS